MNFRIASTLLALALPLCAQEQSPSQAEATFYKAYYLEKGQRDFAGAMALYEEFLSKAPEHALAKEAAANQFKLLDRTGKTKERDAFKAKYEKLLGNIADAPTRPAAGGAGEGGERGERGDRPQRGQGGPGGPGGGRGSAMRLLFNPETKLADLSKEEVQQVKDGLGQATRMVDMVRNSQGDEAADKLEGAIGNLKKALDADKMDDAQKALDALRESMPRMGGRRGGGGEGGDAGGGQRRRGGGGGEGGGAGGGGRSGGGGGGGGGN